METMKVDAKPRTSVGTRASRAFRKAGLIPAIIYGHNEPPEAVALSRHDVDVALAHGARTLELSFGGGAKSYLIKEVQYDHLQAAPVHLDLARVDLTERVHVMVGIELRGVPKGVNEGGVLDQQMSEIEVECLVTDIPDTLHPVVADLGLGQSLLVKDLVFPPDVTPLADPEERVATVRELAHEPEPTELAGEEEAAEPERIGRVRKEEGKGE